MRTQDILSVSTISLILFCVADWRRSNDEPSSWVQFDSSEHLGAEYNSIAKSISQGEGFSNPFRSTTGPTAWMPPVLVYLLAFAHVSANDNEIVVVDCFVALNLIVVIFSGVHFVTIGRRVQLANLSYILLFTALATHLFRIFQETHDTTLILLITTLLWVALNKYPQAPSRIRDGIMWGGGLGISALCSPIVAFAFATATIFNWHCSGQHRCRFWSYLFHKPKLVLILALVTSIAVVSPWIVRSRIVLGTWIPVKSNAFFEAWQSQVLDDDGVLDVETCVLHPWSFDGEARRRYARMGEVAFMNYHRAQFLSSIKSNPIEYVQRVYSRFIRATIFYRTAMPNEEYLIWPVRFKQVCFPFAFLCFTFLVLFGRRPIPIELRSAMQLYVLVLLPYVAISYVDRYSAPLLFVKAAMILYAIDRIRSLVKQRYLSRTD